MNRKQRREEVSRNKKNWRDNADTPSMSGYDLEALVNSMPPRQIVAWINMLVGALAGTHNILIEDWDDKDRKLYGVRFRHGAARYLATTEAVDEAREQDREEMERLKS